MITDETHDSKNSIQIFNSRVYGFVHVCFSQRKYLKKHFACPLLKILSYVNQQIKRPLNKGVRIGFSVL